MREESVHRVIGSSAHLPLDEALFNGLEREMKKESVHRLIGSSVHLLLDERGSTGWKKK